MAHYTKDGLAIAIIHEGQRRGISQKGIQIALSTALVESDMVMHCNDNDPESKGFPWDAISYDYDSSGLFQQRPAYWGTCQQRMDPAASAGMFYDALGDTNYNTDEKTPGMYAYEVQQCAEEYAYRYDERYPEACNLYERLQWMECPHQPGVCTVAGAAGPLVSETWIPEQTNFGELILPYDHNIVPQETGYWCGPASTQVVLNGQGIFISEQQLANEIGTHTGGTDYIGQIETVLDGYVPDMHYNTVDQPFDPMSYEDKERLWANLIRAMAEEPRGGVVMNWVAPPGNYPIGIKGSESPTYGGGTIYHYVACMGLDDNPNQRACWIADSGFYPFGYWCDFEQVSTLIPPKGYCYAAVEPAAGGNPGNGEMIDMANVPQEQWDSLLADVADIKTQLRGPNNAGWEQLGQNAQGQNLSVVDGLASVKRTVEGQPPPLPGMASRQGKERQQKGTRS
jgi:Peptidase_C39 like family